MSDTKTLAASLRAMHAACTPAGYAGAVKLVAMPERMADLLAAAEALEKSEPSNDAAERLAKALQEEVRQVVMTVKFEQRGELEINRVLDDLCRRLGVEL